ncbi:vesicle-associated membrane protein 3-like isoform X2 [Mauremys mutica]|uniref:vesicle-associated membrane protein 3-like isoform X2 n=1 Tax=Mauremys mutica TaxID=74926 RepID=UPI001D15F7FC|nr:vesicle-associated membrane protein 3-like isoform X2 [Mauremys mutica]
MRQPAVIDIMRVNVDKVLERDPMLSELDDALRAEFETNATKLKKKYWWKNCKIWAVLIAFVRIIIIITITESRSNVLLPVTTAF